MRTLSLIVFVLVAIGVTMEASAQEARPPYSFSRWIFHLGDDVRWAAPDWDDGDWQDFNPWYYSPASDTAALFWNRITVEIYEAKALGDKKGLDLSILGAFDVYWDGHLIGQSGQVGASLEAEVAGAIDNAFLIPDSLYTPGTHTLALRISTFSNQRRVRYYVHRINLDDYPVLTTYRMRVSLLPLLKGAGSRVRLPEYFVAETEFRRYEKIAVCSQRWKLIENRREHRGVRRFELQTVGGRQNGKATDQNRRHADTTRQMRQFLGEWERRFPKRRPTLATRPLEREAREQLEALGYLD